MNNNRVALVTGASRGIGKAIAIQLAELQYNIIINYRSNQALANEFAQELEDKYKIQAICVQGDIIDTQCHETLVNTAKDKFNRLDVLVNNAGITQDNLFIRMKDHEWQNVINTNLLSIINLTNLAGDLMSKQDTGGKIINIGSIVGVHGNAGQANYSTAKSAINTFTRLKAKEYMPKVQVNCIAPGLVKTDMTSGFDLSQLESTPIGRPAYPEDIANTVSYLVKSGSYVTGQIIKIDNGLSLWSDVQSFSKK